MLLTANCIWRSFVPKNQQNHHQVVTIATERKTRIAREFLAVASKTILRVMQLTAALLLFFSLSLSARSVSQTVTIKGRDISFKTIFSEIRKQTGFLVVANKESFNMSQKISVNVESVELPEFLNVILKNKAVQYEIRARNIFIKKTDKDAAGQLSAPSISHSLDSPPITVRGRVLNEKGEPVVASVTVKGTNKGTTTDNYGNFLIEGLDEKAVLIVSGINIESKEIEVNGRNEINITSITKIASEEEVIVNKGYYTISKRLNTGSVVAVKSEDIAKQPVNNPLAALSGRMSGVFVRQTAGAASGPFTINIRGNNSLRGDANNPLYLIDGIPFNPSTQGGGYTSSSVSGDPFSTININDIESIEVLKDADATAIYGSRGSNGVVLITTKKGKAGKTKLDLDVNTGFGKIVNTMELLNTQQYLEMRREAFQNDGATPSVTNGKTDYDLLTWDQTRYTDWQKILIGGTAKASNAQASLSGGNQTTQFLISGGYYTQSTVFPGDFKNKKGSGLMNIVHQTPNKRLKISLTANYSVEDDNTPSMDLTMVAVNLAPNAPALYTSSGDLNWENSTWVNPLSKLLEVFRGVSTNFLVNSVLSYEILPGLTARINVGYNNLQRKATLFKYHTAYDPIYNATSAASQSLLTDNDSKSINFEPQIDWKKTINNINIEMLAGATLQDQKTTLLGLMGTGFSNNSLISNLQAANNTQVLDNQFSRYRYNAVFARIGLDYRKKYLLNITARRDGSSRFGPDKRFGNFGSIGTAWIFSNETFVNNNLSFISFGKLRSSYGITGSDQIGDYQYLDTYYPNGNYNDLNTLSAERLANADYSWETNKKFEVALEAGFFRDRLFLEINWYRNRSSNQLVGYNLPATTGFTDIQSNFPATVQNTGWEFSLNSTNIRSSHWNWKTGINLTIPRAILVAYPNIEASSYRNTYQVGGSLYTPKRYDFIGVDPQSGIYTFEDVDGNGILTNADRQFAKRRGINFYGGFQNVVSFRGLELDALLQFVDQVADNYMISFSRPGSPLANQPIYVLDRWQKPGDSKPIQRFSQLNSGPAPSAYNSAKNTSNYSFSDASYIRLKTISISYNITSDWLKRAGISLLKLHLQAQNIFTHTKYLGLDPETRSTILLPPLKMITGGVKIVL